MMNFQVGDKVCHTTYGLGEVIGVDEKVLSGEKTLCYVVRIEDLTLWVPAVNASANRLRFPTPKGKFDALFNILRSPGEPLSEDRNERKMQLQATMQDGKPDSFCKVLRDLTRFSQTKKLNEHDVATQNRARNFLLNEWSLSLGITINQAEQSLRELLTSGG